MATTEQETGRGKKADTAEDAVVAAESDGKSRQETLYVILHQPEEGDTWVRIEGYTTATNKDAAVNAHLETLPPLGEGKRNGRWKAISSSAWRGGISIEEITEVRAKKSEIND